MRVQNRTRRSRLGNLSSNAIVSVQQDPFSAPYLTNVETAEKVFEEVEGTEGGGRRSKRTRNTRKRRSSTRYRGRSRRF